MKKELIRKIINNLFNNPSLENRQKLYKSLNKLPIKDLSLLHTAYIIGGK
jgi:hypothetical protein